MEFGDWFTHHPVGKENVLLSVMWFTNNPWHKVAAHLINFTNDDLGESSTVGECSGRNNDSCILNICEEYVYRNNGVEYLLVNCMDDLKRVNEKLRAVNKLLKAKG